MTTGRELSESDNKQLVSCERYLKLLLYLLDFELLKFPQSLSEFEKCNKDALAKSLWLSHRTEKTVFFIEARDFD